MKLKEFKLGMNNSISKIKNFLMKGKKLYLLKKNTLKKKFKNLLKNTNNLI